MTEKWLKIAPRDATDANGETWDINYMFKSMRRLFDRGTPIPVTDGFIMDAVVGKLSALRIKNDVLEGCVAFLDDPGDRDLYLAPGLIGGEVMMVSVVGAATWMFRREPIT